MKTTPQIEDEMMSIIRDQPVTAETISVITGLPVNYVLNKLYKLEKYKVVERVTTRSMIVWGMPRD